MLDDRAIRYLPEGFRTRFSNLCRRENLRNHERPTDGREAGWANYCYDDVITGFKFIHHFSRPIEDDAAYGEVMQTFRRRFDRLYSAVESAGSVLFVLSTMFPYDPDLIDPIHDAMAEIWPRTKIDLRIIQFGAPEDKSDPGRWGGGLFRYRRERNPYDFAQTNWEWSFLDAYIPDKTEKKPRGLARLAYKLSKSILNSLRRRGYDV